MTTPDFAFVDLAFLGNPGVIGTGVLRTDEGIWLVDPGPASALPGLAAGLQTMGLSMRDVRGLLLTHIHLDHAGASGTIVRQFPEVRVFVHERGAPHVIDPSRLLESAGRLYQGTLTRLWGEVAPVPEANVQVLKGGEQLLLGGRRIEVAYTPGHASHHVSYFDPHSGSAFLGDTGGARLAASYVVPPTPPPDINLEAWTDSLARIGAWNPSRLFLTHFGAVADPEPHIGELEQQLSVYRDMVRRTLDEAGEDDQRLAHFVDMAKADMGRALPAEQVNRYQMAVPLDHCWLGLARYFRRKAEGSRR